MGSLLSKFNIFSLFGFMWLVTQETECGDVPKVSMKLVFLQTL